MQTVMYPVQLIHLILMNHKVNMAPDPCLAELEENKRKKQLPIEEKQRKKREREAKFKQKEEELKEKRRQMEKI